MNWKHYGTGKEITCIEDMPEGTIGFVYLIHYDDKTRYIGKKSLYSTRKLPALKSGEVREGAIRTYKVGSGKREYFDKIQKESDWKKYKGSHSECKTKTPQSKYILAYAPNKLWLTYLETKFLFSLEVLENDNFINDNILGTFYRANLTTNSLI